MKKLGCSGNLSVPAAITGFMAAGASRVSVLFGAPAISAFRLIKSGRCLICRMIAHATAPLLTLSQTSTCALWIKRLPT
jgi:hypothetical protein